MNYSGTFDAKHPADGSGLHSDGHAHVETITRHATHVPAGAIIVEDSQLLFNGDFKRSGVDLVLSRDDHKLVLHDYFKGEKHAALSSPDGAHLTGDIVDALTGHTQYAQADGGAGAGHVIGHVTKLVGNATIVRNGVSVILNNGDNVEKGDVVQSGANSTLGVTFIDGTVFGLSSNARMVLNEMVYDPNGSNNSSLISLVAGTISFVAGETAKHGDMKIDTPVATMGIRGTAVLCEIDFDVPGQGGAPNAHFQVLVEPDGTTGSYILFDKSTLTPIATVNQAGQQINISNGQVSVTSSPLSPEIQKLITDVFSLKFSDANPQTFQHFTDSIIPQSLQPIQLGYGPTATPVVVNVSLPGSSSPNFALPPTNPNSHIAGPPVAKAIDKSLTELLGKTHATDHDTATGNVNYGDINAGDEPSVTTSFGGYTYENAAHKDLKPTLNALQLADIKAIGENVALIVEQDPNHKNTGSATWTYSVADGALDFLAAGETLTLTYVADVNNNFAQNPEHTLVSFTITITGTNDVPVITTGPQFISFTGGTTTVGGPLKTTAATSGMLSFTDVDLTDTHQVKAGLTKAVMLDAHGNPISGFTIPPTPLAAFNAALSATIASGNDSTGSGNGKISWTLADLPAYLADFIPSGDKLTLTYTVTVTDSQNATSTQNITVTITGNENAAEVWIATTASGTGDWNTGTNWETGLVPTASDDAIIITNQLVGKTPLYPVTINAADDSSVLNPDAVANSLTMNDFGTTPPELDNNGVLEIGGALTLSVDSILKNFGTLTVGALAQILNKSVLQNSGSITLGNGGEFDVQSKITNSGTIEVTGGKLNVLTTVTNTDGEIDAAKGAEIDLENATVKGGKLGGSGSIDVVTASTIAGTAALNADLNTSTVTVDAKLTLDNVTASGTDITDKGGIEFDHNVTLTGGARIEGQSSLLTGAISNLGTLEVAGLATLLNDTLTNTGQTVQVDGTGILTLNGAGITGGTINDYSLGSDHVTVLPGSIDVTGDSTISGASLNNGSVKIEQGVLLTLDNDKVTGTSIEVDISGGSAPPPTMGLVLKDGTTLTNSQLTIDSGDLATANDATISGGTVANSGILDLTGTAVLKNGTLNNAGTVNVTGTGNAMDGETVTANHMLEVLAGGALLTLSDSSVSGGALSIGAASTLNLDGSTISGGTLSITGTLDSTGTSFITGETIINASHIDITGGTLTIDPAPFTNTGTMLAIDGGTLVLSDEIVTNSVTDTNGTIQVDAADETHVASTLDLEGSTINGGNLIVSGVLDSTGNSFLTGTDITYSGTIDVTGGTLIIDATSILNNTGGKLDINGGNLIVDAGLSGNVEIKGASVLELGSAAQDAYNNVTVTFDDRSTGTLKLDDSKDFHGTIVGLAAGDVIDLTNVAYASNEHAVWTQTTTANGGSGTLQVYNGSGTLESTLNLDGAYSQNQFALAQDNTPSHGTDVNINNYISFSDGTINTNGVYTPEVSNVGSTIELTNGMNLEATSWFDNSVHSISKFTVSFDYSATAQSNPADGIAFILQNSPAGLNALGSTGSDLGYGSGATAITPSAAIELNIFHGHTLGTNLGIDGVAGYTQDYISTHPVDFWDTGDTINVGLTYNGSVLTEKLTDLVTSDTFAISYNVNLADVLGSETAFVGFSAGTGASVSTQTISNFTFAPLAASSTIVASAPNQMLSGFAVADTFVFNFAGVGHATVEGFHPATDTLQFSNPIFATAQAAWNATLDDGHGNTVITLDAHNTITLAGIAKAQLHVADFHVV